MTRTCRYPPCDRPAGETAGDGYRRGSFCSPKCELRYEHVRADVLDRRPVEDVDEDDTPGDTLIGDGGVRVSPQALREADRRLAWLSDVHTETDGGVPPWLSAARATVKRALREDTPFGEGEHD